MKDNYFQTILLNFKCKTTEKSIFIPKIFYIKKIFFTIDYIINITFTKANFTYLYPIVTFYFFIKTKK